MTTCDLHFHSIYSPDAFNEPRTVIENMLRSNCKAFAVADHDNLQGVPIFKKLAEENGLGFIEGVELSASDSEFGVVHILGYGIDISAPSIVEYCESEKARAKIMYNTLVDAIIEEGHITDVDEYNKFALWNYPDRALGMKQPRLWLLKQGVFKTLDEANIYTNELIRNKKLSAAQTVEQAINAIHEAGGVAIIAHPAEKTNDANKPKPTKRWQVLCDKLLSLGADGIESFTPFNGPASFQNEIAEYAKSQNAIVTGGTDFHNTIDGDKNAPWKSDVPISIFDELVERLN